MAAAETELGDLSQKVVNLTSNLNNILGSLTKLETWIPAVDVGIQGLNNVVEEISARVTKLESMLATATFAAAQTPVGPDNVENHQGNASKALVAHERTLVKGKSRLPISPVNFDLGEASVQSQFSSRSSSPRLPKTNFPRFDGDNPKLWKKNSEKYFDMYQVPYDSWANFATLHFVGNAALWLQTYEALHSVETWPELCVVVHNKFGKDKYQEHLEELESLRQTSGVDAYYSKFEELMHRVLVYNQAFDETYFVTKFVGGLKTEIKAAIKLHKPRTVDAALSLAKTQEDLALEIKKGGQKSTYKEGFKSTAFRVNYQGKGILGQAPDDTTKTEEKPKWEDCFESLKAARKAKGECFKCGEKWGPGHKCPKYVQLHVLEELLEVFQLREDDEVCQNEEAESSEEELVVSECVVSGTMGKKTIRLQGLIQNHEVLILIDSGSSNSFISQQLVEKLGLAVTDIPLSQVIIADGGVMQCDKLAIGVEWWCQGHSFTNDLKVLKLGGYDIILGMDWLEHHSPMWIHWQRKKLRFTYQGKKINLVGVKENLSDCKSVTSKQLKGMLKTGAVSQVVQLCSIAEESLETELPPTISAVLKEFQEQFKAPSGLPPHRSFDHSIPLLSGSKPVNVKPYRYAPKQKDEIERQVKEMLLQGIIKPSSSPFASPVLLVKKKDGTWRFCVDYRGLNDITVKNKYPMLVVDELLDELSGAQWFTKLDLRSGYHQIRLVQQDEHKTTFKTHQELYEFRVMPFGLTNAPASFQGLMNTIFDKMIRRNVLVFVDDILVYSKTLEEHVQHLREVFAVLQQHKLFVKASKCSFAKQQLEYLGHIIGAQGVATDPSEVHAVQDWLVPRNLKQLRGFLGLTSYYRKFIKNYGIMTRPLTALLKKGVPFKWAELQQQAFSQVKWAMVQAPVLALPDFSQEFIVETDACDKGIGAVLLQNGHPIAYLSKALGVKAQALFTYEKECLAILMAVNKWRAYLQNNEFVIQTNHKSLTHLGEQKLTTSMQHKAFIKLMGLQYKIRYKQGAENRVADALSRRDADEELSAISVGRPKWLESVVDWYDQDEEAKQLLAQLIINLVGVEHFTLTNGVIRF